MHIQPHRCKHQAGHTSSSKQSDKTNGVEHRGIQTDVSFAQSSCPVEYLYRRRDGDEVAKDRERHGAVNRLAGYEHVVSPNQKTKKGDGYAGKCHEHISENPFSRVSGDQFAYHSHSGQNHDVNGRMGVKPKKVLKENRIAADRWVEHANLPDPFDGHEKKRDCQNGSS